MFPLQNSHHMKEDLKPIFIGYNKYLSPENIPTALVSIPAMTKTEKKLLVFIERAAFVKETH